MCTRAIDIESFPDIPLQSSYFDKHLQLKGGCCNPQDFVTSRLIFLCEIVHGHHLCFRGKCSVTVTISWRSERIMKIELTLFLWHMPDDATEGGTEHSPRLQPSIDLHARVTAFIFSLLWYPVYYPERMKAPGKALCSDRNVSVYWPPLRIRTRAAGFKILSGDHYTTTAHKESNSDN